MDQPWTTILKLLSLRCPSSRNETGPGDLVPFAIPKMDANEMDVRRDDDDDEDEDSPKIEADRCRNLNCEQWVEENGPQKVCLSYSASHTLKPLRVLAADSLPLSINDFQILLSQKQL